jgi:hypothetical protein
MDEQPGSHTDQPIRPAVRAREPVRVPGVFVVELFLPSDADKLERLIKRHNWHDTASRILGDWDLLAQIRADPSYEWWTLGASAGLKSPARHTDARPKKLPAEFDEVVIEGVRIGDGITAVVATFFTGAVAAPTADNSYRHARRARGVRHAEPARQSIHESARRYLARECPGFFAENKQPQPLIDLLLFSQPDTPPAEHRGSQQEMASRAIGLAERDMAHTSPELPGIYLRRISRISGSQIDQMGTWALWGYDRAIIEYAARRPKAPAITEDWVLVDYVREAVGDYLLQLSISELLCLHHRRYMQIRDQAPRRRGRLRMSHIKEQRTNLLVLSLNVRTTERAIRHFNERERAHTHHLQSALDAPPGIDQQLATDQAKILELLKADDEQYREILAAALSLTSSMQSLRASRVARWIAVASLATSFLLLMLSDSSQHPRIATLAEWIWNHP